MIDIIIPTFNQEMYTVQCLKSLRRFTKQPYRIVWVDNGSSYESRKRVLIELKDHKYLTIWLSERIGFIKAVNIALKHCHHDYVVILNNDTEVTENWLDLLMFPLVHSDRIIASGPLTTRNTSHQDLEQMKTILPELLTISNEHLINIHYLQKKLSELFVDTRYVTVEKLAFFCTVFKRAIFDEIGLLDERFKEGYSDDMDFSMRMRQKGYDLVLVPAAYVEHYHQKTFLNIYSKKEASAMLHQNRKVLHEKWQSTESS